MSFAGDSRTGPDRYILVGELECVHLLRITIYIDDAGMVHGCGSQYIIGELLLRSYHTN